MLSDLVRRFVNHHLDIEEIAESQSQKRIADDIALRSVFVTKALLDPHSLFISSKVPKTLHKLMIG